MALPSLYLLLVDTLSDCYYIRRHKPRRYCTDISANMVVPIFKESFEVPVFALPKFINLCTIGNNQIDDILSTEALCIKLGTIGAYSTYQSIPSKIRDAFDSNYEINKLIVLKTKNNITYYISQGIIFDSNLYPIMSLSWELKKVLKENGEPKYKFVRPILRVDPKIYLNKDDDVLKYIINKIIPEALLVTDVYAPSCINSVLYRDPTIRHTIKVEIDNIPFKVKIADRPSVSTTNKELLDIAVNYIDEMMQ